MKQITAIFGIFAVFLACLCAVPPVRAADTTAVAQAYTIGAGDILTVSVWQNPDLTRQVAVQPDGVIHVPLAGAVAAGGRTVAELETRLKQRLETYIPDPVLNVSVSQVNSLVIFVTGKVNNPGQFSVSSRICVLKALSLAGGLTPFAKSKEISIFRKADGTTRVFHFNYKAVARGENIQQHIILKRGDVVVVN